MQLKTALSQWAELSSIGRKPRTVKYHQEILQFIRRKWPEVLELEVDSITQDQVAQFAIGIGAYSPSRFNAAVSALRATVPAARALKRRPAAMKDRPLLSHEEFGRLLEQLDRRPQSHAGLVIRFLAHTGLRINEARQIRWRDVGDDFVLAPGSITKNGRPRLIPFVNGLADVLQALRRIAGRRRRVIPQAECKRSLQTACRRAGVPRLSHHDFRHLFATRCIQSGVDVPTVARWLGHSDGGALLARTYYHLADEHSLAMAAKVKI